MKRIRHIALVFALLCVAAGCELPTEPPTATEPPATEKAIPIEETDTPTPEKPPTPEVKPEFFVADQVMITGPDEQVDDLASTFDQVLRPAKWSKDESPRLDLGTLGDRCKELPGFVGTILVEYPDCLREEWVLALYDIIDGTSVEKAVREINEASASQHYCARSDPNYLLGYPYTVAGSPYTVAGSPYTVAGSPYTVAGSPWTNYGNTAQATDFWNQWALEQIGSLQRQASKSELNGQGVRIGIFDTSPFEPERVQERFDIDLGPSPATGVNPTLALTVTHPEIFDLLPVPTPTPPPAGNPPLPDLSSHGLSVAGLAHAVADGSNIYLYRVLDQYARGNLFVLDAALLDFVDDTLTALNTPNGAVINLSLGIDRAAILTATGTITEVLALDLMLGVAHCQGLTVVAAAGNTSNVGQIVEAEVPAAFPYVIGAMASNYDQHRACFSNRGDVAAPGGDGDRPVSDRGDVTCQPPWEACDRQGQCDRYSLLGPVWPNGYEAWVGTSFSAPLVSGLAALVLEEGGGSLSSEDVSIAIMTPAAVPPGSDLPTGIISVTGSLQP